MNKFTWEHPPPPPPLYFGRRWRTRDKYPQAALENLDVPTRSVLELIPANRRADFSKTESDHVHFQNRLGHCAVSQVPETEDELSVGPSEGRFLGR